MANTVSAKKRVRKTAKQQARNRSANSRMRSAVKQLRQSIAAGETDTAQELLPKTVSIVDSMAAKGVIHRNAASRTKSRLTRAVAALAD